MKVPIERGQFKLNGVHMVKPASGDETGLPWEYYQKDAGLDKPINGFEVVMNFWPDDLLPYVESQIAEAYYKAGPNAFLDLSKRSCETPLPADVVFGYAPLHTIDGEWMNKRVAIGANRDSKLTDLATAQQYKQLVRDMLKIMHRAGVPGKYIRADLKSLSLLEPNVSSTQWDCHEKLTKYYNTYDNMLAWHNLNQYTPRDLLTVMKYLDMYHVDLDLRMHSIEHSNNQGLPTLSSDSKAKEFTKQRIIKMLAELPTKMVYNSDHGCFELLGRHQWIKEPWYGSFMFNKAFQDRNVYDPDHLDQMFNQFIEAFQNAVLSTTQCISYGERLTLNRANDRYRTSELGRKFTSRDFRHFDMSALGLLPIIYLVMCAYVPFKYHYAIAQLLTYTFACPIYVTSVTEERVLNKDSWYYKAFKKNYQTHKSSPSSKIVNVYYNREVGSLPMQVDKTLLSEYWLRDNQPEEQVKRYLDTGSFEMESKGRESLVDGAKRKLDVEDNNEEDNKLNQSSGKLKKAKKKKCLRISYYIPYCIHTLISGALVTSKIGNLVNVFMTVIYFVRKIRKLLFEQTEKFCTMVMKNAVGAAQRVRLQIVEKIRKYATQTGEETIRNNILDLIDEIMNIFIGGDDSMIASLVEFDVSDISEYFGRDGYAFHEDIEGWNDWDEKGVFLQNWYFDDGSRCCSLFRIVYSLFHLRRYFDLSTVGKNSESDLLLRSMMFGKLSNIGFNRALPRYYYDSLLGILRKCRMLMNRNGINTEVFNGEIDVNKLDWWGKVKLEANYSQLADYGRACLNVLAGAPNFGNWALNRDKFFRRQSKERSLQLSMTRRFS